LQEAGKASWTFMDPGCFLSQNKFVGFIQLEFP
jgi:hypothetical protein